MLALALGQRDRLPSPEELQRLLAQAEVNLFVHQPRLPEAALAAGWYLHGVASSPAAFDLYTPARQRRAFQVSAHVLDLAMQDRGRSRLDRCRLAFGAAVGYRRGELEPNAMAVFRRARAILGNVDEALLDRLPFVAFEVGLTFLGFETRGLADLTQRLRRQLGELRRQVDLDDLGPTIFGPLEQIVEAADRMRRFLVRGYDQRLSEARELLRAAARPRDGGNDLDARWVAAHLLALTDDAAGSSVWTALPPSVPPAVKQALVLTDPPVVTLWQPQLDLFRGDGPDILDSETRRVVMSLPTSAGKTLVAQMLALTHLATGVDSVCYVAPMRSLGREVRDSLRGRLRVVRRELGSDLPDFLAEFLGPSDIPDPHVDVMTPERLGFLMRNDLQGVLDRYGMFIFDEAHLIADATRGFDLEWVLAMLHWKTRETNHRIVLLSAALGNRLEIKRWVDPDDAGRLYWSEWRGPRRLHAVFYTDAQWEQPEYVDFSSPGWPQRVLYPLEGRVQLRPAEGLAAREVKLAEPVGTLAFRVNEAGGRESSPHGSSTKQYRMSAQIAVAVGSAGPVLIVVSTRPMARQMARAIASHLTESRETRELTAFVRARLGDEHPIVPLLPYRVAYHHAGLPTDVLEALERSLREERLLYLTATTTLTEGVNLPVRSVVLAETRYPGQDPAAQILGARLINAMGRAGRATKETEGWAVICKPGTPRREDFARMRPADEDLTVTSRLATADALEAVARFEETAAGAADAVFEHHAAEVNDFVAFVWLVLTSFDELNQAASATDIDAALSSTLAFAQLEPAAQQRWRDAAHLVREAFQSSEPTARRRWARTGTSIASARSLDEISQRVATMAQQALSLDQPIDEPDVALEVLHDADALNSLLALEESPRAWGFRPTPNAPRSIHVSPRDFLRLWISGADIGALATEFLAGVQSRELAVEQVVDAISEHCEHYLSWTLGVIVAITNERLSDEDVERKLCENLPLYVRYGVDSAEAVELISSGLRSRAFADRVAAVAQAEDLEDGGLREWLQALPIDRWRAVFEGTPADFLDLLEFTRTRGRALLGALLAAEQADVQAELDDSATDGPVTVRLVDSDRPPQRFGVFREAERVGAVSAAAHADVAAVIDSGLEFRANVLEGTLVLSLTADSAAAN
ncbi:MAG: DEAD/DEAH box helicase [Thermoleophilaceae bacterium]